MLLIAPPPAHSGFPEGHSAGHGTKAAQKANTSLLLGRSDTIEREKSDTTPLFAEIKTCCILGLPPILSPLSPEVTLPGERCNFQWTCSLSLSPFLEAHKIWHIILVVFFYCLGVIVVRLMTLWLADQPWHRLNGQAYPLAVPPVWYGYKVGCVTRLVPQPDS